MDLEKDKKISRELFRNRSRSGESLLSELAKSGSYVLVEYDYEPNKKGFLNIKKGDVIRVDKKKDSGWWRGFIDLSDKESKYGKFPSNYTVTCPAVLLNDRFMGFQTINNSSNAQDVVEYQEIKENIIPEHTLTLKENKLELSDNSFIHGSLDLDKYKKGSNQREALKLDELNLIENKIDGKELKVEAFNLDQNNLEIQQLNIEKRVEMENTEKKEDEKIEKNEEMENIQIKEEEKIEERENRNSNQEKQEIENKNGEIEIIEKQEIQNKNEENQKTEIIENQEIENKNGSLVGKNEDSKNIQNDLEIQEINKEKKNIEGTTNEEKGEKKEEMENTEKKEDEKKEEMENTEKKEDEKIEKNEEMENIRIKEEEKIEEIENRNSNQEKQVIENKNGEIEIIEKQEIQNKNEEETEEPKEIGIENIEIENKEDLNKDEPKNLSKQEKRLKLIEELLDTEKSYIAQLDELQVAYDIIKDSKIIPDNQLNGIFLNARVLRTLHKNLLSDIENALFDKNTKLKKENPLIGAVVAQMTPYFKLYVEYVNRYDDGTALFNKLINQIPNFTNILNNIEIKTSGKMQKGAFAIKNLRITPIQRVKKKKISI